MKKSTVFLGIAIICFLLLTYTLILIGVFDSYPELIGEMKVYLSILFGAGVVLFAFLGFKKKNKHLVLPIPFLIPAIAYSQVLNHEPSNYTTAFLILAGVGGILIHVFAKVRHRFSKANGNKLTWKRFTTEPDWGRHALNSVFALFVVLGLALMRDSLTNILPLTYLVMAGVAYQADSIWKNVTNFKERETV